MEKSRRRIAVKQAFVITLFAAIFGLIANWLNPHGAVSSFHRPVATADADSVFVRSLTAEKITGGVAAPSDLVRTINTTQLARLHRRGLAVVLDARLEYEFDAGHIPGAVSLPYELFFERQDVVAQLPKDKWLVTYCDGPPCDKSHLLAQELKSAGFFFVAIFDEGLDAWRHSQSIQTGKGEAHE